MMVLGILVLVVTPVVWTGLWLGARLAMRDDWVAPVWLAIIGIPGWPALGAYLLGVEDAAAMASVAVLAFLCLVVVGACTAAVRFR